MGAIIAAFGQKGHRYSTPNSSMMLHSIIVQSMYDSIEKHTVMMDYIKDDYEKKVAGLANRLIVNKKQLTKIMGDTHWMSPKRAMKIGLIDGIWTPQMERAINKELRK
jgi:ATP-dependent protease ClpP protease subunit